MHETLRDLLQREADTVARPRLDVNDLVARTERRLVRRRVATATAGVATVVLIMAGGFALQLEDVGTEPAPQAPTKTPTQSTEWTPERIRAEGRADVLVPPTASGLTVREYVVCDESPCVERPRVLEVSQNGESAIFEVRGAYYFPPWVTAFDEDSVLFQDVDDTDVDTRGRLDGPVRFDLLQADGTEVELRLLDDPAPAVPGPDVVLVDDLAGWFRGYDVRQDLYLVDDRAGTLQRLDVPRIDWWGPNYREFLWGGDGCRVTWQGADGGFEHHDLGCRQQDNAPAPPTLNGDPFQDWLEPGRMAVVTGSEDPLVHLSLDYGATWQRVRVEDEDACRSDVDQPCLDAIAETLRKAG